MAVQTSSKSVYDDDFEDEDGPTIFKRSKPMARQNQLNSEVKKSLSERHDGQSNGQNSSSQKGKMVTSNKASSVKSLAPSPKASTSSIKASTAKSPVANSKALTAFDGHAKHSSEQNMPTSVKVEKNSVKYSSVENSDSEDDKPLSARLKGNSNHAHKGFSKPVPNTSPPPMSKITIKKSPEDSDDEVPLSSRFPLKSNVGTSGSKAYGSDEKKPLASKIQQNGSTSRDKQQKSSMVTSKRPLDKANSSEQSLVKKMKLSEASAAMKIKQVSVKADPKADDDDHIPISQRMKKSFASDNKSSATKQKPVKNVSSAFKKKAIMSKKAAKNSKYIKSTKMTPSSGDGQKKWTTLVHSGVIFPPSYTPHGVKILYNGKPVGLTPEQEEVGLSLSLSLSRRSTLFLLYSDHLLNIYIYIYIYIYIFFFLY
jgi:DNA topoisomerase-1